MSKFPVFCKTISIKQVIVIPSDEVLKKISQFSPRLIILDIWLNNSKLDGFMLLKKIKNFNNNIPVIMISGHGNIETAIIQ